jgi:hypothetical protein
MSVRGSLRTTSRIPSGTTSRIAGSGDPRWTRVRRSNLQVASVSGASTGAGSGASTGAGSSVVAPPSRTVPLRTLVPGRAQRGHIPTIVDEVISPSTSCWPIVASRRSHRPPGSGRARPLLLLSVLQVLREHCSSRSSARVDRRDVTEPGGHAARDHDRHSDRDHDGRSDQYAGRGCSSVE